MEEKLKRQKAKVKMSMARKMYLGGCEKEYGYGSKDLHVLVNLFQLKLTPVRVKFSWKTESSDQIKF